MNIFEEYQLFRKILVVCPCCGKLRRVADLRLRSAAEAEKTWLDEYDGDSQKLSIKEQEFEEQAEMLRKEFIEKGRKEAEAAFQQALCPSLQELNLNPYDVKPIFHPIDFIAFKGMTTQDEISEILLLAREKCTNLNTIRNQIKRVISNRKYDWQVARIADTGSITIE